MNVRFELLVKGRAVLDQYKRKLNASNNFF
jgi:hypothetical protein